MVAAVPTSTINVVASTTPPSTNTPLAKCARRKAILQIGAGTVMMKNMFWKKEWLLLLPVAKVMMATGTLIQAPPAMS
jgi:hypothetical protein